MHGKVQIIKGKSVDLFAFKGYVLDNRLHTPTEVDGNLDSVLLINTILIGFLSTTLNLPSEAKFLSA